MSRKVILSTPLLLENGTFRMETISLEEAQLWVRNNAPTNFVGHSTVKVLGIEPAATRDQCTGYDVALSLKPNGRLEFGKEYTIEEVLAVGVTCQLISRV